MLGNDCQVVSGKAALLNPGQIQPADRIITRYPPLQKILANLPLFARSELPVLLVGEPGTGKELVAEALWQLSPRRSRPFLRTNCATYLEPLAGSELFGHLQGSFTDARRTRSGKFKLAHGGTLFLDEVGDLPLSVQPRLLRAVEQGEIEPVGADAPVQVDVRLVAASNQDLPGLISQGRFRQDLYDRLAVLLIQLPPLRERGEDVLLLASHFARDAGPPHSRAHRVRFTPAAARRLTQHHWPGNVRELKNVITRAVLFSAGRMIRERDLSFTFQRSEPGLPPLNPRVTELPARPDRAQLEELLLAEGGNISALSRRLRVCSKTIYRWLNSHHIDLMQIRAAGG
ncbi:MAG: sigma-54 dependent transcriptional regulator [Syntrophales bacterium]|nr:sigma-54 dependent transcriptional regulator [Syntrophales bacterium]MDD5643471.1 sigma-54 dependent transcriptional regulator [Syntrophales bacterium]